jgi:hypothetical protein
MVIFDKSKSDKKKMFIFNKSKTDKKKKPKINIINSNSIINAGK